MDKFTTTNVIVNREQYRELRKILIDKDMSFSTWVRIKIEEELRRDDDENDRSQKDNKDEGA